MSLLSSPFQTNLTSMSSFHMWQSCSRLAMHGSCPVCSWSGEGEHEFPSKGKGARRWLRMPAGALGRNAQGIHRAVHLFTKVFIGEQQLNSRRPQNIPYSCLNRGTRQKVLLGPPIDCTSCREAHGNEAAFAVGAHPQLTPHLGNHSTSLCKGLFMLKKVKTHGDKSFGHGFVSARSSSLCFLANPLVRGNIISFS